MYTVIWLYMLDLFIYVEVRRSSLEVYTHRSKIYQIFTKHMNKYGI